MDTKEALDNLVVGWKRGARWLWIGGGEPTVRRDLLTILKAAKRLGYERVKMQTNGMLLAYPELVARCADAGLTEVSFSIKGSTAALHDELARTPGCHELMVKGIAECKKRGLVLEADVLVYKRNVDDIPAMVRTYFEQGVERFSFWLLSVTGAADPTIAAEVPRISDVVRAIGEAMDLGLSDKPDFITSLHTPPCTVPPERRACLFFAADLGLYITNPGGFRFMLEESPIEGGTYLPSCDRCSFRSRCSGARADYVAIYGSSELEPVP
jgi:MoaA/NifB/PqqE/SkfB family radical SAM enzyme